MQIVRCHGRHKHPTFSLSAADHSRGSALCALSKVPERILRVGTYVEPPKVNRLRGLISIPLVMLVRRRAPLVSDVSEGGPRISYPSSRAEETP